MTPRSIRALRDRHLGGVVIVAASGASLDHIDRRFFHGQKVVAVNETWQHVQTTYALMHHHERAQEAINQQITTVVSDVDLGGPGWGRPASFRGDYYTYRADLYSLSLTPTIDADALARPFDDHLVTSACSTAEALQFAGHLGAGVILCVGLDGAALDGVWNVPRYNDGAGTNPQHVRLTAGILKTTIAALRAKGIAVHSLSPFVGYDQEGHRWTPAPSLEGRALIEALNTVNWQQDPVAR